MPIRTATLRDHEAISAVHHAAFPDGERERVARLAIDLLSEDTEPPTIGLVAEIDDRLVGHVAFSPAALEGGGTCRACILAPLAVAPEWQGQGVGSALIEAGMQRLSAMAVNIVLVYGDPAYYGRFGFSADAARDYVPPRELAYPFAWQAAVLDACVPARTPVAVGCVASLRDPALW